jgi:two-component system OmpR family response regulator
VQILYVSDRRADRWLVRALRQMGHVVELGDWAADTAAIAEEAGHDIILADMARPEPGRAAQLIGGDVPTLVVADEADAAERAAILRAGADACLTRPLHLIEVESRLMALARLTDRLRSAPAAQAGLVFDRSERALALGDQRVSLSAQQFRLVAYLFRRQGEVVGIELLDRHLHGDAAEPRPDQVRAMVTRLRRRLRDGLGRALIENVRGHGYVLRLDPPARHGGDGA